MLILPHWLALLFIPVILEGHHKGCGQLLLGAVEMLKKKQTLL